MDPLIYESSSTSDLLQEYQDNPGFLKKLSHLILDFKTYRKCKGDGNCFYRAFAFSWFETVLMYPDPPLHDEYTATLLSARDLLDKAGFEKIVYEDFVMEADETLNRLRVPYALQTTDNVDLKDGIFDTASLLSRMQNPESSNSVVAFLRMVISAYLQENKAEFSPFLGDLDTYCRQSVEAMGSESEEIHIIALTRFFKINISVVLEN